MAFDIETNPGTAALLAAFGVFVIIGLLTLTGTLAIAIWILIGVVWLVLAYWVVMGIIRRGRRGKARQSRRARSGGRRE